MEYKEYLILCSNNIMNEKSIVKMKSTLKFIIHLLQFSSVVRGYGLKANQPTSHRFKQIKLAFFRRKRNRSQPEQVVVT